MNGSDLTIESSGAFNLFWEDLKKPDAKSRYYQRLVMMPDGGVMMLTCLAALMRLLDDEGVTNFETDTTFSRVAGDMNEWEVVIFLKALQRGEFIFALLLLARIHIFQLSPSLERTSIKPAHSSSSVSSTSFSQSSSS